MVCSGLKPRTAEWKAQTNPLSYGGTQNSKETANIAASGQWLWLSFLSGPRFESSHRGNFVYIYLYLYLYNCIGKTKINKEVT